MTRSDGSSGSSCPRRISVPQHLALLPLSIAASVLSSHRGVQVHAWGSSLYQTHCPRCRTKAFQSSTPLEPENGEDETIDNPERLQDSLTDLFRISSGQKPNPSEAYSAPDNDIIKALLDISEKGTADAKNLKQEDQWGTDEGDGIFLDADTYLHSSDFLGDDGSLNLSKMGNIRDDEYKKMTEQLIVQHPNLPEVYIPSNGEEDPTLESLMRQRPPDPTATSEELHRQVFENEQGYLNQSQAFRDSLGADGEDAAVEAAKLRRGANFRQRQDEQVEKLEKEMQDFLDSLEQPPSQQPEKCFKCGCPLSEEEIAHFVAKTGTLGSKRLCSVCYADVLVARSDKSFFRAAATPRTTRLSRDKYQQNKRNRLGLKTPPLPRASARPGMQIPSDRRRSLDRDQASADRRDILDAPTSGKSRFREEAGMRSNPKQNQGSQDERKRDFDRRVKGAPLVGKVNERQADSDNKWIEVEDPDTGETFYWNEETEEMKWEL